MGKSVKVPRGGVPPRRKGVDFLWITLWRTGISEDGEGKEGPFPQTSTV